jgi:hypothetical protein
MGHMDSRIIGGMRRGDELAYLGDLDDLGDLIGGDDDLGDLIGEVGRRRHRHRQAKLRRLAHRMGMETMPREQAAALRQEARSNMNAATNMQALASGDPMTAGRFVADGGQRELYLPFEAAVLLGGLAGSTAVLRTNVQRPMMVERVIVAAADSGSGADVLGTCGVSGILLGVQPVFNAPGITPAVAFAFNAVGVGIRTMVAVVGTIVTVQLVRTVTQPVDAVLTGYMVGVSAEV